MPCVVYTRGDGDAIETWERLSEHWISGIGEMQQYRSTRATITMITNYRSVKRHTYFLFVFFLEPLASFDERIRRHVADAANMLRAWRCRAVDARFTCAPWRRKIGKALGTFGRRRNLMDNGVVIGYCHIEVAVAHRRNTRRDTLCIRGGRRIGWCVGASWRRCCRRRRLAGRH